jgi:SAM-dependent methyltransferase
MDFREYEVMYRAEDRHWWYAGLRDILFRRTGLDQPRSRAWHILDAGCGTGGTLQALRHTGHLHAQGFDYSADALYFCRQRGLRNVREGSIMAIPFPDSAFDLLISNDVLCDTGTPNESCALREMYRVLRPGGRVFLNLPAYTFMRSEHDRAVDVDRRYTMPQLRRMVRAVGFEIARMSHWNALLFPIVLAVRLRRKHGQERAQADAQSDIRVPPAPLNQTLTRIIRVESRLMDWITIPYGSSIICLARRSAPVRSN